MNTVGANAAPPAADEAALPAGVEAARSVSLSLVSHTNVGKTTLARTLLGRDIGEVRDEAHVTEQAEGHVLVRSPAGDVLLLWDTPGFGDSLRLARRLSQAGSPIGWLLTEVWDRLRDRPFWATQRAVRHVLGRSDLVLYLVNAAEAPEDAAYLDPELQVLTLIGKPVIALLNQVGLPEAADEAALLEAWRQRLAGAPIVRELLPLDAFTRCWLQEAVLWQAVGRHLPAPTAERFHRLRQAWLADQQARFDAAMAELARRVARAALDRQPVADGGWRGRLAQWRSVFSRSAGDPAAGPAAEAMALLAERLDADVRASINRLIELHGLQGKAGQEVLARLARHFAVRQPLDEGQAAVFGGLITGALAGLKADLLSGGLTLGGGLLAGGVIGALGAAGAARGVNRLRGLARAEVAWEQPVLEALAANALLGYLAVAHHGRGRGAWLAVEPPPRWTDAVQAAVAVMQPALKEAWRARDEAMAQAQPSDADAAAIPLTAASGAALQLQQALARALALGGREALARLYPEAQRWIEPHGPERAGAPQRQEPY